MFNPRELAEARHKSNASPDRETDVKACATFLSSLLSACAASALASSLKGAVETAALAVYDAPDGEARENAMRNLEATAAAFSASSLGAAFADLSSRVGSLETQVGSLRSRVATAENAAGGFVAEDRFDALAGRVSALETPKPSEKV